MKKSAFFDVDYTLYNGYLGSNLTRFLTERGYAAKRIAEEELELQRQYAIGAIDYREAARWSLQLNADALQGKTIADGQLWLQEFIAEYNFIYPWAAQLITLLKIKGYTIYLISAALSISIETVATLLDVENYFGTTLAVKDGVYTGKLDLILNYEEKHSLVQKLIKETAHEKHVGFGDSLGDVDMLGAVDVAVVYNPKSQELVSLAQERGWFIASDETILQFAQGSL